MVLKIYNSIFWNNNSVVGKGRAIAVMNNAEVELYNSLFMGSNIVDKDNIVEDDETNPFISVRAGNAAITGASNNIDGSYASVFGNGSALMYTPFQDVNSGNYKLVKDVNSINNPTINGGSTTDILDLITDEDLEGNTRINHDQIDLGVYEYAPTTDVDQENHNSNLFSYISTTATLQFSPEIINTDSKVEIFDIKGALVEKATSIRSSLCVNHLINGTYLVKVQSKQQIQIEKIIVK